MQVLFSIITITYNAETTVQHTIESVLAQTYTNIEYIIVDGASTDATMSIAAKYKDAISKIISEKDTGIYDAMNKGLAMATGDYVWFMNAGDTFYSPNTLADIAEQLNNNTALPDIIYGETAIVDNKYNLLYMRRLKAPEVLTWKKFSNGMLVCHQSFVVKRAIATAYDLQYRFSADYDWCIRCTKAAAVVCNTHLILSNYLNEGTTTRNLKASLKERFTIMCKHYGKVFTYLQHIKFAFRFGLSKITGQAQ